jgi:hypothetical protein
LRQLEQPTAWGWGGLLAVLAFVALVSLALRRWVKTL